MISLHWFRQWLCIKQSKSHYMNQWWQSSLMHTVHWSMCVSLSINELMLFIRNSLQSWCIETERSTRRSIFEQPFQLFLTNLQHDQWWPAILTIWNWKDPFINVLHKIQYEESFLHHHLVNLLSLINDSNCNFSMISHWQGIFPLLACNIWPTFIKIGFFNSISAKDVVRN